MCAVCSIRVAGSLQTVIDSSGWPLQGEPSVVSNETSGRDGDDHSLVQVRFHVKLRCSILDNKQGGLHHAHTTGQI